MIGRALPESLRLRPMLRADLPGVHRLELMSQPIPWPLWLFRRQLRSGASCWVLEAGGEIAGFGIVAFDKQRAHIMNMCVAPGYRRRGLGQRIMLHLLDVARHRHCRGAWLEVRRSNRPAVVLYRKLGFRTRRIGTGYYPTRRGRLNGAVMARPLRSPRGNKY